MLYVKNKGIQNENEFIEYFNNRIVGDLDSLPYSFIHSVFSDISDNDIIRATYRLDKTKSDFLLSINDVTKKISIKNGRCNSVHLESIGTFISFLRKNGINENIIEKFLYYHYADGTKDGTGVDRISVKEYKDNNQNDIDIINKTFSDDKIIMKAIDRFLLVGKFYDSVDLIVYGNINDFVWITKNEIYKLILSKKDEYATGIHFGPLFCQPWTRNLQHKQSDEYKRDYIQIKWYSLKEDIENISNL